MGQMDDKWDQIDKIILPSACRLGAVALLGAGGAGRYNQILTPIYL